MSASALIALGTNFYVQATTVRTDRDASLRFGSWMMTLEHPTHGEGRGIWRVAPRGPRLVQQLPRGRFPGFGTPEPDGHIPSSWGLFDCGLSPQAGPRTAEQVMG